MDPLTTFSIPAGPYLVEKGAVDLVHLGTKDFG